MTKKECLLMDGKATAQVVKNHVAQQVRTIRAGGNDVTLAVVQVGHNPASDVYIRNKKKACEEVGIKFSLYEMDASISETELKNLIMKLNDDIFVTGIMVQLPLPDHIDEDEIKALIMPMKDVDGFNPTSVGLLHMGTLSMAPCTAAGIMRLLEANHVGVAGKHCVVVGRSDIVGKPVSAMLLDADATVTVCHSKTVGLKEICKTADVLVVAVGKSKFINHEYVKDGAVVIDVGINRDEHNKLTGDVDTDDVKTVASMITPVPGGVGPMTVAMLLDNCVTAHDIQRSYLEQVRAFRANGGKF